MKNTESKITYTGKDCLFHPDLKAPEQTNLPVGKYGQMRLGFIKRHRRGTYTSLLAAFDLSAHLYEIDAEARLVAGITAQLAKERGINEGLKARAVIRPIMPWGRNEYR